MTLKSCPICGGGVSIDTVNDTEGTAEIRCSPCRLTMTEHWSLIEEMWNDRKANPEDMNCGTCRWHFGNGSDILQCRRRSPSVNPRAQFDFACGLWPSVRAHDVCGDWQGGNSAHGQD